MNSVARTARALGWAGILPFMLLPALVLFAGEGWAVMARTGLASYALAITCFLCGAWWGMALIRREASLLLASNAIVVVAWLSLLLLQWRYAMLGLALLLVLLAVCEGMYPMFTHQPRYYRRLRLGLTALATGSLLAVFALG